MPGYTYRGTVQEPLPPIKHGTRTGSRQHYKRGQKPCLECYDADAKAKRLQRRGYRVAGRREPYRNADRLYDYNDFGDTLEELRKICATKETDWKLGPTERARIYIRKRDDVLRKLFAEGVHYTVLMEASGMSKGGLYYALTPVSKRGRKFRES